jgi:hypothetical protein
MQLFDKPRKIILQILPNFYFILLLLLKKMQNGKTSYARQDQT